MKNRRTTIVCVATLAVAGCAGQIAEQQIRVTDASPRKVAFLVQNASRVPMQNVDAQAESHCRQHGLAARRTEAVWIGSTLWQIAYECGRAERPSARKPQPQRPDAVKPASNDPKAAAWAKAKTVADAWALCLRLNVERKVKETAEPPQSVVQEVVDACSGLEHAVFEPLQAVGEGSSQLQTDLHAEAIQHVSDRVTSIRMKAGPLAFEPPASERSTAPPSRLVVGRRLAE